MTREEFLGALGALRMAPGGEGKRHPQKPLFLLWLLGRFQQTGTSFVTYADADDPVADQRGRLLAAHARGQLSSAVEDLLRADLALAGIAGRYLIERYFTSSYVEPIAVEVGLDVDVVPAIDVLPVIDMLHGTDLVTSTIRRHRRDPAFRSRMLHGWRNQCAMCGYDGAMFRDPAGIDAAHIDWHTAGGPDVPENRIALCRLHQALLDLGAMGLRCSTPPRPPAADGGIHHVALLPGVQGGRLRAGRPGSGGFDAACGRDAGVAPRLRRWPAWHC